MERAKRPLSSRGDWGLLLLLLPVLVQVQGRAVRAQLRGSPPPCLLCWTRTHETWSWQHCPMVSREGKRRGMDTRDALEDM